MAASESPQTAQHNPHRFTPAGEARGYIQPDRLTELWIHTGTACNLSCPFCLEGSGPGDQRLQQVAFEEVRPFIDAACDLGVARFAFTGGEPFVNKDIVPLLDYALARRPCLVLTNGTTPLRTRLAKLAPLRENPHPLRFRISFDYPDPAQHDANRGAGKFMQALETLGDLHGLGYEVSIARMGTQGEDTAAVNAAYAEWFRKAGAPEHTPIVVFPEFFPPGSHPPGVPAITEHCMTTYHDAASRAAFMCNFSKMVVKQGDRMRIYACTLVDDDPAYDLGQDLDTAMAARIMLGHHRCFSCFAHGATCSEG